MGHVRPLAVLWGALLALAVAWSTPASAAAAPHLGNVKYEDITINSSAGIGGPAADARAGGGGLARRRVARPLG